MESSLDLAPGYYWESADGLLLDLNQTLCLDLGYAREELLGKPEDLLYSLATRIFNQTHLLPLLQLQGAASEIFISLAARNKPPVSVLCNIKKCIRNGRDITCFAGIAVENRKKFENELIEAKKTAEKALLENSALILIKKELEENIAQSAINLDLIRLQNDELRQFNHVVTHVLQEPIRKITLFSGMLAEQTGGAHADTGQTIDKLLRATARIGSVVSGLQEYAWLTGPAAPFAPVDLPAGLQLAKAKLDLEQPGVEFKLIIGPCAGFEADPAQIDMLLYQLLSNALLFRKTGAPAVLHVESVIIQQNQHDRLPGKYKYADYVKIMFRDEGLGFDPAHREYIFGLFRKLPQQASPGSGIGLALCKKIVENHHGKIMADSLPGQGTTVTVLLPVRPAS